MQIVAEFTISHKDDDISEKDLAKVHGAIVALLEALDFEVNGSCELKEQDE